MGQQDRSAWVREALERFEGPLVAYATHLLGDPHAARDVVQDAFLRLVRADRVEVEPILARWLYTVTRHRAVDLLRHDRTAAVTNSEALDGIASRHGTAPPPEDAATMRDDVDRVRRAMSTLSAGHQEVLRLKLSHGLSYADIAKVTGLSTSHVGVKLHEGMKALRSRLGVASAVRVQGGVQ
jgi:RNA polymerase sigma factor (sigma-70 family)